MLTDKPEPEEKFGKVNYAQGYWYHFEDGDNDITVNASAYSGMHRVYINDQMVCKKRKFGRGCRLEFEYEGAQYSVRFATIKLLTVDYECLVIKDNTLLGRKVISFYSGTPGEIAVKLSPFFILGAISGSASTLVGLGAISKSFSSGFAVGIGIPAFVVVIAVIVKLAREKS